MTTIGWGTSGADVDLPWSGNSTLTNCTIVSSAVQVAQAVPASDANTLGLWLLNEGSGASAVDSSATGNTGLTVDAGAGAAWETAAPWQGAAHVAAAAPSAIWLYCDDLASPAQIAAGTYEAWIRPDHDPTDTSHYDRWLSIEPNPWLSYDTTIAVYHIGNVGTPQGRWSVFPGHSVGGFGAVDTGAYWSYGDWVHVRVTWVRDASNGGLGTVALYVNGNAICSGAYQYAGTNDAGFGQRIAVLNSWANNLYAPGAADTIRLSSVVRSDAWTRYAGYGIAIAGNSTATGTLTRVAWDAGGSGAFGGAVNNVKVYTGGQWVQVGGYNPTSPITGLALPVVPGNLLRFRVDASSDSARSETTILTSATATITTGGLTLPMITRLPGRVGPSLAGRL